MLPFDSIERGGGDLAADSIDNNNTNGDDKQFASHRGARRRTMMSQTKSLIRNAHGSAKRRKQRRKLKAEGRMHPDDNKPLVISPHLRRTKNFHRAGYVVAVILIVALTFTTPHTYARTPNGDKITADSKNTMIVMAVLCVLSMLTIQGSDPGLIDVHDGNATAMEAGEAGSSTTDTESVVAVKNMKVSAVRQSQAETSDDEHDEQYDERSSGVGANQINILANTEAEEENRNGEETKQQSFSKFGGHDYEVSSDGSRDSDDSDEDSSDSDDDNDLDLVDDIEPDEQLDAQLLGVDKSLIPIRAKYCRNSRRVVATFDHYCAVLGTCIGEKNHFRFFMFLALNTATIAYGIAFVHSGFRDTPAQLGTWLSYNSHALGAAIVLWLMLLTVGGLFMFHWFLGMANMTSYEFMRSEKISYLVNTRDFDLPFSNGFRFNMRIFVLQDAAIHWLVSKMCRGGGAGREWKRWEWGPVGEIKRDEDDWASNMWENKYWSCC